MDKNNFSEELKDLLDKPNNFYRKGLHGKDIDEVYFWENDLTKFFNEYDFVNPEFKKYFNVIKKKEYKEIGFNWVHTNVDIYCERINRYVDLLNKINESYKKFGNKIIVKSKDDKNFAKKIKEYKDLLSFTIDSEEENLNLEAYKYLFKFENELRNFIKKKLKEYYSINKGFSKDDWYRKGISESILKKINENKSNMDSFFYMVEADYPLEYMNISDYIDIFKNNGINIFGCDKGLLKKLKRHLGDIIIPRNKIAHSVNLPKQDVDSVRLICNFITSAISRLQKSNGNIKK